MYDLQQQKLFVQAESESKNKFLLEFSSVEGWGLSPFENQNILFDLYEFDIDRLPEQLKNNCHIPREYLECMRSDEKKLFYLESSVGMSGYVIATKLSHLEQVLEPILIQRQPLC